LNPVEALIFFQASSFQLLKLENLLRWSFFTFIYNRSSYMNYFICTSHHILLNLVNKWKRGSECSLSYFQTWRIELKIMNAAEYFHWSFCN